jgi:tetratricopeptide (TPR) repeat protein
MRCLLRHPVFFVATFLVASLASAETGFLVVHVEDVQRYPIVGLQIAVEGDGGSAFTLDQGTARIRFAKDTKANTWVSLQILKSPTGKDYVMVSPWDYRAQVPSFENETENFVRVVVVQRGDRAALENGSVLAALTAKINQANAPKSADKQAVEDPKASLEAVAKQYGLSSGDLDKAIRAWGDKTNDPYDVGLAALYARNYDAATSSLQDSLKQREEKLATAQKDVADSAFFLGSSLYEQGKYRKSADAYQRCLQIRPDDPLVLNNAALSLEKAGDYGQAEPLFQKALEINQKQPIPDQLGEAAYLNNLAMLLQDEGDYKNAETRFRQALAISTATLAPNDPRIALSLNNLGLVLYHLGRYTEAESFYRQALSIEKVQPKAGLTLAITLNNLAELLRSRGDVSGAEPLFEQALAIQKTLDPDNPEMAATLNNLGELRANQEKFEEAEQFLQQALAIWKKADPPNMANIAKALGNLGFVYKREKKYDEAEQSYKQALAIWEKNSGPNNPNMATTLNGLAAVYEAKGDYVEAEPLLRQALAIDEKALGPDHPTTQQIKSNLDYLLNEMAQPTSPKAQN